MQDKAWGILEFQENGKRTANTKHLECGDKVIFYLCGEEGYCILGDAILGSSYGVLVSSVFHEKFLDLKKGVTLMSVNPWKKSLPIELLRGKVRFVPEDRNFGSYIQGSITSLSERDYDVIIQEHKNYR